MTFDAPQEKVLWNKLCLWNTSASSTAFSSKTVTLILDLDWWPWTGTNRKVLSQGILRCKMKALSLTNQKIWPTLQFLRTNNRTSGWAKNHMSPIYLCGGTKIVFPFFFLFPICFLPSEKQTWCLLWCLQMLLIWTRLKFCHLMKNYSNSSPNDKF